MARMCKREQLSKPLSWSAQPMSGSAAPRFQELEPIEAEILRPALKKPFRTHIAKWAQHGHLYIRLSVFKPRMSLCQTVKRLSCEASLHTSVPAIPNKHPPSCPRPKILSLHLRHFLFYDPAKPIWAVQSSHGFSGRSVD